jgi:hypothetical protein
MSRTGLEVEEAEGLINPCAKTMTEIRLLIVARKVQLAYRPCSIILFGRQLTHYQVHKLPS